MRSFSISACALIAGISQDMVIVWEVSIIDISEGWIKLSRSSDRFSSLSVTSVERREQRAEVESRLRRETANDATNTGGCGRDDFAIYHPV
jgi:hypothetical protein